MDILNFISWIASRRRVVTSAPDDALVPIGIRTETRDDKYTTVAIKKSDLITVPEPAYKVYTALLTQVGGSDFQVLDSGTVQKGVTYNVDGATGTCDFTNIGGLKGVAAQGTYFVATDSIAPNDWGGAVLIYDTGAPVVTVLENTIGNIWFTYGNVGAYVANSDGLFTTDKTCLFSSVSSDSGYPKYTTFILSTVNEVIVQQFEVGGTGVDGIGNKQSIEIRVYN